MHYPILDRITGFDTSYNRQSATHHYGSHFARDLSGVPTPDAYLALAQELGKSAARGDVGTFVKVRGNGDLAIYVDTPLSRRHSHFGGIFMVVRTRGSHGLLTTMFAPNTGKRYFDEDDPRLI
jgi:hypothetical protein